MPAPLARRLVGDEIRTAGRMRWGGLKNGELLRRAALEFDVFLTLDRSIQHQQVLPPELAMITLRLKSNAVGLSSRGQQTF